MSNIISILMVFASTVTASAQLPYFTQGTTSADILAAEQGVSIVVEDDFLAFSESYLSDIAFKSIYYLTDDKLDRIMYTYATDNFDTFLSSVDKIALLFNPDQMTSHEHFSDEVFDSCESVFHTRAGIFKVNETIGNGVGTIVINYYPPNNSKIQRL